MMVELDMKNRELIEAKLFMTSEVPLFALQALDKKAPSSIPGKYNLTKGVFKIIFGLGILGNLSNWKSKDFCDLNRVYLSCQP